MKSVLYVRCDLWDKPLWFWVLQNESKPLFSIQGVRGYSSKRCAIRAAFTALAKVDRLRVCRIEEV